MNSSFWSNIAVFLMIGLTCSSAEEINHRGIEEIEGKSLPLSLLKFISEWIGNFFAVINLEANQPNDDVGEYTVNIKLPGSWAESEILQHTIKTTKTRGLLWTGESLGPNDWVHNLICIMVLRYFLGLEIKVQSIEQFNLQIY